MEDNSQVQPKPEDPDLSILRAKGEAGLAELLSKYQSKLERIVAFRLDPTLRRRFDPADVLQEAYIEIARRLQEYLDGASVSFFVWVRQKTIQTLIDIQRGHSRDKRDIHREQPLPGINYNQTTSLSIAKFLIDDVTSPSQAAARNEELFQLQSALDAMNEIDREVLAMRHFEHLSNLEVAQSLNITPTAASNRYVRAAAKLSEILKQTSHR